MLVTSCQPNRLQHDAAQRPHSLMLRVMRTYGCNRVLEFPDAEWHTSHAGGANIFGCSASPIDAPGVSDVVVQLASYVANKPYW
jgi:hypothetical protein